MLIAVALLACTQDSPSESMTPWVPKIDAGIGIEAQSGEQHPPIPANNPIWEKTSKSFQPVPMVYGEERWDDVLMRVFGHLAQASRDLARIHAQAGRSNEAKKEYEWLHRTLKNISLGEAGQSRDLRDLHSTAARLHATLLSTRVRGEIAPEELGPNATRRWLHATAQAQPTQLTTPWSELQIDDFEDFRDRHRLRLEMTRHWLDSVDPTYFSDPWGYWRPSVADSTAAALSGGSAQSIELDRNDYPLEITVADLARLPTGDSYLDTAGGAGPMAIGRLAVLGSNDETHMQRLEAWARELNQTLETDPRKFVLQIAQYVEVLDNYSHGSRFYNIKQLINTGTRHLARAGHYSYALEVFRMHRPLHAQDWLCPNREGIQLGIEGRLLALSNQEQAAIDALKSAKGEAMKWIDSILSEKADGNTRPASHQGSKVPRGSAQ